MGKEGRSPDRNLGLVRKTERVVMAQKNDTTIDRSELLTVVY